MTFLPIVDRELRVAARSKATYRNRMIAAGIAAVMAVLMLLFSHWTLASSFVGIAMFRVLSYLTLAFCLLEGVRKTADCLSGEKREGTLGLLFLTDLKGYDVVFGKLAATSLNSIYGLMAILPILALPVLTGGVTSGEYWRMVLVLMDILFFSLCVGMCVSAWSVREQQATGWTLLLLILFGAVPLLTFTRFFYPFSPVYAFQSAFAANYSYYSGYWESLGLTLFWSLLLLAIASYAVPRQWQERDADPRGYLRRRETEPARARRAARRKEMLDANPITWLASRERGRKRILRSLMVLVLTGTVCIIVSTDRAMVPIYLVGGLLVNFCLKVLIGEQAAQFFAEARRNNSLELLFAAPLTVAQIVDGQVEALYRVFAIPVGLILALELAGTLAGSIKSNTFGFGDAGALFPFFLGYIMLFALDAAALTYTGMWFGLTSKKENQAVGKTLFFILVLPFAGFICWCPGIIFFISCPIFFLARTGSQLNRKVRELAGMRYGLLPVAVGAPPPPPIPPNIPPVISP